MFRFGLSKCPGEHIYALCLPYCIPDELTSNSHKPGIQQITNQENARHTDVERGYICTVSHNEVNVSCRRWSRGTLETPDLES